MGMCMGCGTLNYSIGGQHLMIQISNDVNQQLFVVLACIGKQFNVGLSTALVICITGVDSISRCPLVKVGPTHGVVDVSLLWVNGIKCH